MLHNIVLTFMYIFIRLLTVFERRLTRHTAAANSAPNPG